MCLIRRNISLLRKINSDELIIENLLQGIEVAGGRTRAHGLAARDLASIREDKLKKSVSDLMRSVWA